MSAISDCSTWDRSHWWFLGRNAVIHSVAKRFLGTLNQRIALDYGCGTGGVSEVLKTYFSDYRCFEPNQISAEICRKRGLSVFTSSDKLRASAPEGSDVLFCLDVIEHVSDDVGLLCEAFSYIKEGGLGIITVPANEWLWGGEDVAAHHMRRYTFRTFRSTIERAGLELVYLSAFNSFLLPIQTAVVWFNRILHRKQAMSGELTNLTQPGRLEQLVCLAVLKFEAWLLSRISLPVGGSLIAAVRRRRD